MKYVKFIQVVAGVTALSTSVLFAQEKDMRIHPFQKDGINYRLYPIPDEAERNLPSGWSTVQNVPQEYKSFTDFLETLTENEIEFYWVKNVTSGGISILTSSWIHHKPFSDYDDYVSGSMAERLGSTLMISPMRFELSPADNDLTSVSLMMPGGAIAKNFLPFLDNVPNFATSYKETSATGVFDLSTGVFKEVNFELEDVKFYDKMKRSDLLSIDSISVNYSIKSGTMRARVRVNDFYASHPIINIDNFRSVNLKEAELTLELSNLNVSNIDLINRILRLNTKDFSNLHTKSSLPEVKITGNAKDSKFLFSLPKSQANVSSDLIETRPLDLTITGEINSEIHSRCSLHPKVR